MITPPPSPLDTVAMDLIAGILSGSEWDADTTDAIADLVRMTGRSVDDLEVEL